MDAQRQATTDATGSAVVHLRLRGPLGEEELAGLRQQLAACLRSGVRDVRVHAEDQDDLDLAVLQALDGVSRHLAGCGGRVTLLGAQPRVLARVALHHLQHLLPAEQAAPTEADRQPGRAAGATP